MRDPMDSSGRLKDGTRWRTFMRFLLLDDLITSYTHARPGAGLLVVDLGTRYPYGRRSDFTPTSASWLNMVERFLRGLTAHRLRRGVFPDVMVLVKATRAASGRRRFQLRLRIYQGFT